MPPDDRELAYATILREIVMLSVTRGLADKAKTQRGDYSTVMEVKRLRTVRSILKLENTLSRKTAMDRRTVAEGRKKRKLPTLRRNKIAPSLEIWDFGIKRAAVHWFYGTFQITPSAVP